MITIQLDDIQAKLLANLLNGEKLIPQEVRELVPLVNQLNTGTMNREKWIQGLAEGKRYTHEYFTSSEWVQASAVPEHLEFEDGVLCSIEEFERYREGWPHDLWEEIEK
jgi:hypothetical protein|tara:strand:+ start:1728 stop:2054 length:327 start_codon:yes stop_codon:yes gene_type:complete